MQNVLFYVLSDEIPAAYEKVTAANWDGIFSIIFPGAKKFGYGARASSKKLFYRIFLSETFEVINISD